MVTSAWVLQEDIPCFPWAQSNDAVPLADVQSSKSNLSIRTQANVNGSPAIRYAASKSA